MSEQDTDKFLKHVKHVKHQLDESDEHVDASTRSRLTQTRYQALESKN